MEISSGSLALVCAICFIEGADMALYGISMRSWEIDFGMNINFLGNLELAGGLTLAISGPIWALMADAGIMKRKAMLVMGCTGWGLVTAAVALARVSYEILFCRILVSCMLCSVMPLTQSVIADISTPANRGRYFALVGTAGTTGVIVCQLLATAISNKDVYGIRGWRLSFVAIGSFSILLAGLLSLFGHIPESKRPNYAPSGILLRKHFGQMMDLFKIKSFCVIVGQGLFGMTACRTLHFLVLWYQYSGMSDASAGILSSAMVAGGFLGNLCGGCIGDLVAAWSRWHGRQTMATASLLCSLPLLACMFGPAAFWGTSNTFWYVAPLSFGIGLSTSWTVAGCNRPVLAEISSGKASTMALDWSLELAFGAILGPSIVTAVSGLLGYRSSTLPVADMSREQLQENASALAAAMLGITAVCYAVCALIYCVLHCTYQRDAEHASLEELKKREKSYCSLKQHA
mmetsp:Transcript_31295/g.61427  ORF Transcript_31295/g.61427 Transcript_31295/m.61427 type:complete len:460 (+) Transcript_31295:67-1446(+)|eukprot:CAMPEP_0172860748 /NCGR_PEP_ID=MMETSP1075-20121228/72269_1 /TAXON_ID=2916 /ORGANISM="Ceratium fusus, Strain PA161109" /LENGTH=459 /DNA_ID=CAMNT_0013708819 /DNA_START=67 /DNA_END=1446 /DNA_ORIENTATION=-